MSLWKGFSPQRGLWWAGRFFLALAFFLSLSTGAAWGISIWPPGPPPFHYKNTKIVTYQEEWVARYDGGVGATDAATDLKVDRRGNVIVTGFSFNGHDYDMVTIKYDNQGNQLWAKTFFEGKDTDDVPLALGVDFDGNVYVAGWSGTINSGLGWFWWYFEDFPLGRVMGSGTDDNTSYTIIKYSPTGAQLWVRYYHGDASGVNIPTAMKLDRWGNVYVTGYSWGIGTRFDYATVKYDTNGNREWAARYDGGYAGGGNDYANALGVDSFGQVCVTGHSKGTDNDSGFNDYDYLTVKYDAYGNQVWVARYDGDLHWWDYATALAVDSRNNVYVTGFSMGDNNNDMVTIKYDRDGRQKWLHRYNGPGLFPPDDMPYAMVVDSQLNVYIAGLSEYSICTIKLDRDGHLAWERFIPPEFPGIDHRATRLTLDRYGDLLVTGEYRFDADNELDYATVRYTPEGDWGWVGRYAGPGVGFDRPSAIGVDFNGNVYITGMSSGDFATVKYKRVVERVKLPVP